MPDCANRFLLTDLLRNQWGFQGFVVSDGGAISDIWAQHKYVPTPEAAAVAAVKAGCDFCSGNSGATPTRSRRAARWTADARGWLTGGDDYNVLSDAAQKGLISAEEIDVATSRELTARFRLGLFDPPSMVPYSKITLAQNNTPEHRALALKVARESLVLLTNDGLLPLDRAKLKRVAIIGPNADSTKMLLGNYSGTQPHLVTILSAIKAAAGPSIDVTYQQGCPLAFETTTPTSRQPKRWRGPSRRPNRRTSSFTSADWMRRWKENRPMSPRPVTRASNVATGRASNCRRHKRICSKGSMRPANLSCSSIAAAAPSPCRGRWNTWPRFCKRGIPAKRVAARWRTSCLATPTLPGVCRSRSIVPRPTCRRLTIIRCPIARIVISAASPCFRSATV